MSRTEVYTSGNVRVVLAKHLEVGDTLLFSGAKVARVVVGPRQVEVRIQPTTGEAYHDVLEPEAAYVLLTEAATEELS